MTDFQEPKPAEYLFIGGSRDGHRMMCDPRMEEITIEVEARQDMWELVSGPMRVTVPRRERYLSSYMGAGNREFKVFAEITLSKEDILQRIIAGYKAST